MPSFFSRTQAIRLAACTAAFGLLVACGSTSDDESMDTQDAIVVFDLSGPLSESTNQGGFVNVSITKSYPGLISAIEEARRSEKPSGFLVRFGMGNHSFAQAEELGRLLAGLRTSERPVYCHADSLVNSTLMLAALACDKTWLAPGGGVDTVGIAGQAVYFKGLLEKLKIDADFLHVGKYKGAAEMFTHDAPSDAAKESLQHVLSSVRQSWLKGLTDGQLPTDQHVAEDGPWAPQAALEAKLIDAIGFESDVRDALSELTSSDSFVSGQRSKGGGDSPLSAIVHALVGSDDEAEEPHVAVLVASGEIVMEAGGLSDTNIAARPFVKRIRKLRKDEDARAVVLRIDSPGGSALASDLMWHELRLLAKEKPLVVSVGSMAASGGYYLACAGDHIFAENTSIVGSIGVVGGKLSVAEAVADFGITSHTFVAHEAPGGAERAAYLSVLTPWDDATRARFKENMDSIYALFVSRVSEGRDLSTEEVQKVAQGRIWSGAHGKQHGLVDAIGGLRAAIDEAKRRAELGEDAPVRLDIEEPSFLKLFGVGNDDDEEASARLQKLQAKRPLWYQVLPPAERRHLASLYPLLTGEKVLAVMPFALDIR